MKQLIDVPLKVRSIHSLGKKAKGKAQEDKRIKVVMTNDLTGTNHLGQFFPHPDRFVKFGELHWDDDGGVVFDVGRIPLGYEIIGGHVTFAYPPLWKDKVLGYELVDVKRVFLTPKEGRVCTVALIAIVEPGKGEAEKLYEVVGREVFFSAQWAESDQVRAEQQGQKSMPLPPSGEGPAAGEDENAKDELYDKAVAFIAKERLCAVSLIQKELAIGYNRAARILEQLEGGCIVGPANADGVREILVPEDYQIPLDDSRKEPINAAAPGSEEGTPLVPGQKPPQRPKRTGLPATAGAH